MLKRTKTVDEVFAEWEETCKPIREAFFELVAPLIAFVLKIVNRLVTRTRG